MSIERIKKEAAKADQLIEELAKQGREAQADNPEPEQDVVETPEAAQPEVEQPDQGVVADAATEDQKMLDVQRVQEESAKWEQRYRSLDGMIQARDRQIEQLHQLIAGMQKAPTSSAPAVEGETEQQLVSKSDEEAFGADLIDLARRVFKEEFSKAVGSFRGEIDSIKQSMEGVAQSTALSAQDRFENKLTQAVPQWREVDADQRFIDWLNGTPTRAKLFAEAARSHDVEGVSFFFKEFAQLITPAVDPKAKAQDALAKQVAPGKPKSVATHATQSSDKKVWTRSEIAEFFKNGKRHYGAEEFAKLERDAFAAQREGRVDFSR